VADASPSDERLLADARAGDRQALEMLLERHQAQVYRFGMKMCRDPEDAKDVLQDTLLAMARSVRDFRGASSISTWLYRIARSFCIKKRVRASLHPRSSVRWRPTSQPKRSGLPRPVSTRMRRSRASRWNGRWSRRSPA
jgi:RNA polymerase sigma-70 factor (ECF subfamily)